MSVGGFDFRSHVQISSTPAVLFFSPNHVGEVTEAIFSQSPLKFVDYVVATWAFHRLGAIIACVPCVNSPCDV